MEYLLLVCSVCCGTLKSIISKFAQNQNKTLRDTIKSNIFIFFFALLVIVMLALIDGLSFNAPIFLSLLYALCTLLSQISLMKAVQYGSVSLSSLFYSCGFIIPTIWGSLHYNEGLNFIHFIGLAIMLISFILSCKEKNKVKLNLKWIIYAIGGLLFSGMVGVIQKLFASDFKEYTLSSFLSCSFIFIICICVVFLCFSKLLDRLFLSKSLNESQKEQTILKKSINKRIIIFTAIIGICMGLVNKMNTYLSGKLPSVIVFPTLNGGVIVLTTIISLFAFREKLTLKQNLGVILGVIAIVIIALA